MTRDSLCALLSVVLVSAVFADQAERGGPASQGASPPTRALLSDDRPLSLRRAVNLAESRHPSLAAAAARIGAAERRRRELAGEQRPRLELQAVHVEGLSGAKGAGLGVQGIVSSQLLRDDAAGLNVWQRIYDSGEISHRKRSQGDLVKNAEALAESLRRQVGLTSAGAFLEVLKQRTLVDLYEKLVTARDLFVAQADAAHRAGLRPFVDLGLARVQQSRARSLLAGVRSREGQALASLERGIGTPLRRALAPIEVTPASAASVDSLIARGLERRPELLAARKSLEAARHEEKAVAATRGPQVVGFLSGGAANTPLPGSDLEWAGGVALRVPIDSNSVFSERIAQARQRREEAAATLQDATEQVTEQIRVAAAEHNGLLEQYRMERQEVAQAEDVWKVAASQYGAGLGTFLERSQAEDALLEARARLDGRRFDLLLARLRLEVASGLAVLDAIEAGGVR